MRKLLLAVLLIALPHAAGAKVYLCVDQATGKTTFTDVDCETPSKREEVRVEPVNSATGRHREPGTQEKYWNSQRESRKSGRDFNAQRRSIYANKATASSP